MGQVGHTDSKMTINVYAQVMSRKDGERERSARARERRRLDRPLAVNGSETAPEPSEANPIEPKNRSRIIVEGA